jgi:TonB family protein
MWVAFAAAVVVHGSVLGAVRTFDLSLIGKSFVPSASKRVASESPDVELHSNCPADAILASTARAALCLAPWQQDVDRCVDDAQTNLWIDLSACQARHDVPIAEVAMLEPRQTDRLKPIDPEPLLDMREAKVEPPHPLVPPPVPKQPAPPPPPAPKRLQQVVENAKPDTEQAPDNARFLAEYNTKVERQTVARGTPKEPMVAKSKPEELTPKTDPREASMKPRDDDRPRGADARAPDLPGTLSMRTPGAPSVGALQQQAKTRGSFANTNAPLAFDGSLPRHGDGAIAQAQQDRSEMPRGQGGAGGGRPDVPNLKPSQDVLERALGGGNVDHLEEVDNGDETALNAKRWVFASFFNRLKRSVAQNWDPGSVWRRSDPTGQIYGLKTRVTEVRVSLNPHGDLVSIVVTSPCGVSELDDEAIRAFHAAQPFPNPPKELVASDNTITFAFSFFFEIGGSHTSWRVIRSM